MRIITSIVLLFILVNTRVSSAADELTVKIDFLPVKDIRWDVSIVDLKNRIDRLVCKPGEDKTVLCSHTDNLIESEFEFENNKMSYVDVIISMPVAFDKTLNSEILKLPDIEISSFSRKVGIEPQIFDGSDRTKYVWNLEFETCQATVSKFNPNTGATMMVGCRPGSYLSVFLKKPARDSFKLFDMEFGRTSKKEILNFISKNGWHQFELKSDRETNIFVYDKVVEGVKETKFQLFDNLLESVSYEISDNYKDKGQFYKMLVEKYGKPNEESQNYLKWVVNPDTRDEVSIFMTFANNVSNIKGISYDLKWLGQKKVESKLFAVRTEHMKKEEIKKKAF